MSAVAKTWRWTAALIGVPAALVFLAVTAFLIAGLPITLLIVPFAVPVLLLSWWQAKSARRTWTGSAQAARRLRNLCLVIASVIGVLLFVNKIRGDDGTIRSDDIKPENAIFQAVFVGLAVLNALGFILLNRTTTRRPFTVRGVGIAATVVLGAALLAALFLPRAG